MRYLHICIFKNFVLPMDLVRALNSKNPLVTPLPPLEVCYYVSCVLLLDIVVHTYSAVAGPPLCHKYYEHQHF